MTEQEQQQLTAALADISRSDTRIDACLGTVRALAEWQALNAEERETVLGILFGESDRMGE